MKTRQIVNGLMASLAVLGLVVPQPILAADSAQASPVTDVALRDGGVLIGQVVYQQGAALAGVPVSIRSADRELAVAKSRTDGYFAFKGLRGGVYQLVAAKGHGVYRVWAPGTAPPAAQQGALVISGDPVVRGQAPGGYNPTADGLKTFLVNPLVIAGVISAAVAIPVAIHNTQHKPPSTP